MKAYGGKINGETPAELNSSLDSLDQLGDVGMTLDYQHTVLRTTESTHWVEAAVCVDNPDDGSGQRILTVAKGFYEDFAQEQREVSISIRCQTLTETARRSRDWSVKVIIVHSDACVGVHIANDCGNQCLQNF